MMWVKATCWIGVLVLIVGLKYAVAQPIPVPLGPVANDAETPPPVRRAWTRDLTTYYRLGWQTIALGPLNDELTRNGYSTLSGRFRTMGLGAQMKISRKPVFLYTEVNLGLGTRSATNQINTAKLSLSTFRLGVGYRVWQSRGFQLIPNVGLQSMPIQLRVIAPQTQVPTLSSALNNPGASQTTQLNTTAGAIDVGLTANYRFGVQRRYDDCTNSERSLVLALDGGYRIGSRPEFILENDPPRRLSFPSSGWYVGVRLGAGLRSDRVK